VAGRWWVGSALAAVAFTFLFAHALFGVGAPSAASFTEHGEPGAVTASAPSDAPGASAASSAHDPMSPELMSPAAAPRMDATPQSKHAVRPTSPAAALHNAADRTDASAGADPAARRAPVSDLTGPAQHRVLRC
jgi:hypothetical protein